MISKEQITEFFKSLQDDICRQLENADGGGKFHQDLWERQGGGGGRTRIIEGNHIEKGGVNFSAVQGPLPEKIANALNIKGGDFYATGVSIVLHPKSPMVPIIHMNVRYFEVENNSSSKIWWFGGGIDLTPHYVDLEDSKFFHQCLKDVCDKHHSDYYLKFKEWADNYFFVKHRKETRGIGGIFFDRLSDQEGFTKEQRFEFVKDVGNSFAPTYIALLDKNKNLAFGKTEKNWQLLRRGRYVEFNLVWDKGTKFGLDTDGRTESILMSLPPLAKWVYDFKVEPNSKEEATINYLKKGINYLES